MGDYSQADRAFRVDTPLGEDELLLEGFSGAEQVSAPFQYTLEMLSKDDSIAPTDLLGQPVSVAVRLADGSDRFFHGLVNRFLQLGKSEELTSYQAEVVPWLWLLSLTQDCRIFQQRSVPDIIKEIFSKYSNADFEVKLVGSYSAREYCVQYRESDLNFVSRLMEEEGIYYFFQHSAGGHKLTLVDDASMIDPCPVQSTFEVATTPDDFLEEDVIIELQREHVVKTERVTLRDYDYLKPSNDLEATDGSDAGGEIYDYPGRYVELAQGESYVTLLLQERGAKQEVVRGASSCRTLTTGCSFDLTGYYLDDANQTYFVVGVSHAARGGGYRSGKPDSEYSNHFECVPTMVPYRPPRVAKKPVVKGPQTAVVVGPSGEEIYTDSDGHGRVKVQFHWDRLGAKDENSSCWVRVSSAWAGKNWGGIHLPRIGQEVIIDHQEGDPDRPIITGRVYNADQVPPYKLPANKTQSGIKSRSSKDGTSANFNEIRMEDKKGSELLYVHAEKDKSVVIENDRTESVGHDESISIGNDRSESVGNNESITIGKNRTESVGADESITIGANRSVSVSKNETIDVGQNRSEGVGKNEDVSVGEKRSHNVGKDDTLNVGNNLGVSAGDSIMMKTGRASITMKKNGDIVIKGKNINIQGSGKIQVKASSDVNIKGSKVTNN
jgi:type VI secretion system secreted protein VgrG